MPVVPLAVPSAAVAPAVVGGSPTEIPGRFAGARVPTPPRRANRTPAGSVGARRTRRGSRSSCARPRPRPRTRVGSPSSSARTCCRSRTCARTRASSSRRTASWSTTDSSRAPVSPSASPCSSTSSPGPSSSSNPAQPASPRDAAPGVLGCSLTERLRGQLGLVVETKCEWLPEARVQALDPREGARKNWISQGLTASKAVVMADSSSRAGRAWARTPSSSTSGTRRAAPSGPGSRRGHGRKPPNSTTPPCVRRRRAPALGAARPPLRPGPRRPVCAENPDAPSNMELIGQRLFTGRVAVAQGAHEFRRRLFRRTRAATDAAVLGAERRGERGRGRAAAADAERRAAAQALYVGRDAREARVGRFCAAEAKSAASSRAARGRAPRSSRRWRRRRSSPWTRRSSSATG